MHSLDVYWNKLGISNEHALRHEILIGDYMRQVVMAREFSRFPPTTNGSQIEYDSVTITEFTHLWHPYYDQGLPKNIDTFDEPYRKIFSLIKDLSNLLLEANSNLQAMSFLASLLGVFALSYPIEQLNADLYFHRYLVDEVQDTSTDDDYTYYLCRMIEYSLFNRS
jgi:hypothetical protein